MSKGIVSYLDFLLSTENRYLKDNSDRFYFDIENGFDILELTNLGFVLEEVNQQKDYTTVSIDQNDYYALLESEAKRIESLVQPIMSQLGVQLNGVSLSFPFVEVLYEKCSRDNSKRIKSVFNDRFEGVKLLDDKTLKIPLQNFQK